VLVRRAQRLNTASWSADGTRLAVTYTSGVDEIDLGVTPPTTHVLTTAFALAAGYDGDTLYVAGGDNHVYRFAGGRSVDTGAPVDTYATVFHTRDAVGFVSPGGLVTLVGRGGRRTLHAPVPALFRAAGARAGTRFVVGTQRYLLAYDAAHVLPRILPTPAANTVFAGFAGTNRLLMAYMIDDWKLFDLPGGQARSFPKPSIARVLAVAPDGSYVLLRPDRTTKLAIARPDKPVEVLDPDAFGLALSPTRVAIIHDRDLAELDLTTGARRPLWSGDSLLTTARDGPYLVAVTRTQLWRRDERTGTTTTRALRAPPDALDVATDGTVYVATGRLVERWATDGALTEHGRLDRDIALLAPVERVGLVALDRRHQAWSVKPGAPTVNALPSTFAANALSEHAALALSLTTDRQLVAYDLEGKHQWTLGDGDVFADLSDDGAFAATYASGQVAIYALGLPRDRAAYQALLDATTNLRVGASANDLIMPP